MSKIPEQKARYICDGCGKKVIAYFKQFSDDTVICGECETRALIWSAKQSLTPDKEVKK